MSRKFPEPVERLFEELEAALEAGNVRKARAFADLLRTAAEETDSPELAERIRERLEHYEDLGPISLGPDRQGVDEEPKPPVSYSTSGAGEASPSPGEASPDSEEDAPSLGEPPIDFMELESPKATPKSGTVYPVWYGTNRRPNRSGGFGGDRHDRTSLGRVLVHIPKAHRFGEIGNPWWKRLRRLDLRDDRLRILENEARDVATFWSEITAASEAARAGGEAPQALVYIHGFNVSFDAAAIRAAQIGFDLKVPGPTAFFSWPSKGRVTAYKQDEASIEASEGPICEFLAEFARRSGADTVHLIAHSMGNRGLLRALQRLTQRAEERSQLKFGQIFLAAPDVDRDLFLSLAHLYPQYSTRTTLYASQADRAVKLSGAIHGAPRAGYFPPYTAIAGIDSVAVPDFDIDLLGHSYFANAEALLYDLFHLIRQDQPPSRRQRLEAFVEAGLNLWRFRR